MVLVFVNVGAVCEYVPLDEVLYVTLAPTGDLTDTFAQLCAEPE